MLALTSAKAATYSVDILLFLGCILTVACIKGAATDREKPDVGEEPRWWDERP